MSFEQYAHHGKPVWVRSDLKGTHRENCLCHSCDHFRPNEPENCFIAAELFALCKKYHLVTPVFECPVFRENLLRVPQEQRR